MKKNDSPCVGIDIGTTKICVVVGEASDSGGMDMLGLGCTPSHGLRKGVVVNLEATVDSIKRAVEEAELMAGISIERAYVGMAGGHIRGFNSRGVIPITGRDNEISDEDIRRVLEAAQAVSLPPDRSVFHAVPQEFLVDDQNGISNPRSMSGSRLEANVHIVTASVSAVQNLVTCVNRTGIEVIEAVLEPLATSHAVLTQDERELGVALVDIGGGTTDMAIFERGTICHTAVLPTGGDHLTNDIAVGLRTPIPEAEKIKKRFGCALSSIVEQEETLEVSTVGGRRPRIMSRRTLCEIIQPRAEEVLSLLRQEIERSGYFSELHAGMVLTGGGSMLEGLVEMAEQTLNLPVRCGSPRDIGGLTDMVSSPVYGTGIGLALYGLMNQRSAEHMLHAPPWAMARMTYRLREWFAGLF
ncbi:MAG: cell division protein FtsA [Acidobacteriota bacterium]|nr:cell division protein FtsA [Acidobacteriota bacterium]